MKRKKVAFLGLLICILFSACSKRVVFEEYHEFNEQKWNNFDPIVFKLKINNIEDCYNIYLSIKHFAQFSYPELKVLVGIDDPSGTSRNFYVNFKLKDKDGYFLGKEKGDLWNLEIKAREFFFFNEKGDYTFTIQNATHYYEMTGIKDFGLKIEKAKIDYNIE